MQGAQTNGSCVGGELGQKPPCPTERSGEGQLPELMEVETAGWPLAISVKGGDSVACG